MKKNLGITIIAYYIIISCLLLGCKDPNSDNQNNGTKSYTVTFYLNDGTDEVHATKTVTVPKTTIDELPAQPVREGYGFTGWNTKKNGSGEEFDEETLVTANIALYAQWRPAFTVTFYLNGGTDEVHATKTVTLPAITIDSLPAIPLRENYVFTEWNTEANGTGAVFNDETLVIENINLYAKWSAQTTYKIEGSIEDTKVPGILLSDVSIQLKRENNNVGNLIIAASGFYSITGVVNGTYTIQVSKTGYETKTDTVTVSGSNARLNFKLDKKNYTVIFDSTGGNNIDPVTGIEHGSKIDMKTLPKKGDEFFRGWYKNVNSGTKWNFVTDIITEDITLYAKWSVCADPYTLGGSGTGGGIIFYINTENGFIMQDTGEICHYLEAAPLDAAPASNEIYPWCTQATCDCSLPRPNLDIGYGRKNTALIIAHVANVSSSAPAAITARNYINNGKDDWFLPSRDELNSLYEQRTIVGNTVSDKYWSSSQAAIYPYNFDFSNGNSIINGHSQGHYIRPIRAF